MVNLGGTGEDNGKEPGEEDGNQPGDSGNQPGDSGNQPGDTVEGGGQTPADGPGGQVQMKLEFPAEVSGPLAVYDILFTMDYNFRFQEGDRLEYDVWLSEAAAGIGGLDLCFGYEPNQVLRETGVDADGIGAHPASDLSGYAYQRWHHRSIGITDNFITDLPEGVGPAVVFAADIPECKALAGKNVTVCYGNIRITRNGKTVQDIFPGQNAELPKNLVSYVSVNPGVRVQYGIAGKSPKTGEALPEVPLLLWAVSGIALTGVVCQRKRGQIKRRL